MDIHTDRRGPGTVLKSSTAIALLILVIGILLLCLMPILIWRRSRNRPPELDKLLDDL